jgi:hypothetical protein
MTNLTKQEFIKEIEGLGFEHQYDDKYWWKDIWINTGDEVFLESENIDSYFFGEKVFNNTLKLIKMILEGIL